MSNPEQTRRQRTMEFLVTLVVIIIAWSVCYAIFPGDAVRTWVVPFVVGFAFVGALGLLQRRRERR